MNPKQSQNNLTSSPTLFVNESRLLRTLLEGTGEWAVIIVDAKASIQMTNGLVSSLLKMPATKFAGADFFELIKLYELDGSPLKLEENPLHKVLNGSYRQVQPFFCWFTRPGSEEKLTLAFKVIGVQGPLESTDGAIVYLREAQRKFDPKSVDRSFVSFAAHQLKTPAGAVQGFLEMVLRDISSLRAHPRSYKYIISAYEANLSLIRSAKDLLNSAKLRGGLIEPDIKTFDLVQAIEQKLGSHQQWLTSKKIRLRTSYEMDGQLSVNTDRAIVVELFDILFHNALKYSHPAGVIQIGARREGGMFYISVLDEGPGLAAAQSKINEELSGSGMGLKVARQYAALLKGNLVYKEVEPKGSSFELELPDFA